MLKRKDVQTGKFQVMGEDGFTHTITEFTEHMYVETAAGGEWIPDIKRYDVANRGHATRISDLEFLIGNNNMKARRI